MKSFIRDRCVESFLWREDQKWAKKPLYDLGTALDQKTLLQHAEATHMGRTVIISFLTKEYLSVGWTWIEAMKCIGLSNFIIVAGDAETSQALKGQGVTCIEAALDIGDADPCWISPGGFTPKGLGLCVLKFPVVLKLLREGFDVVLSDVDAIWLRNPLPVITATVDMAFQRVAHFPKPFVKYWGFAACSGFVFFRATAGGVALAEDCLREQRVVQDDQLALNLALLENDVRWNNLNKELNASSFDAMRDVELEASFEAAGSVSIEGETNHRDIVVLALAHHQFWRHGFVNFDLNEVIICHPNSLKCESSKIDNLRRRGVTCFYAPQSP